MLQLPTYPKQKFPLPNDFFRPPPLTSDQSSELIHHGIQCIREVLEDVQSLDVCTSNGGRTPKWSFDSELAQGVKMYLCDSPYKKAISIQVVTTVQATLHDSAALFQTASHRSYIDFCTAFHPDAIDAAILYTIAKPNADHPRNSVTVKWTAFEAPSIFMKATDYCTLEFQDDFAIRGAKGWANVFNSIDRPSACPNLLTSMNLVRGHIYRGGYVFQELPDKPGYLQLSFILHMKYSGPQWVAKRSLRRRVQSLALIRAHLERERALLSQRHSHLADPFVYAMNKQDQIDGTVVHLMSARPSPGLDSTSGEESDEEVLRSRRDTFVRAQEQNKNQFVCMKKDSNWLDVANLQQVATKKQLRSLLHQLKAMQLEEESSTSDDNFDQRSTDNASHCATTGEAW